MRKFCVSALIVAGCLAQIQIPEELGSLPGDGRLPRREPMPISEATGLVRRVEKKSVVVEADDARLITIYLDAKSKLDATAAPGDTVFVTANVKDGRWTAIEIRHVRTATAKERERAQAPLPVNAYDTPDAPANVKASSPTPEAPSTTRRPPETDSEGRPRIRRGPPMAVKLPPPAPESAGEKQTPLEPAISSTRFSISRDPVLVQARTVSANYSSTLPNFIAKQFTTRYERQPKAEFQVQDQIECEVIVENGLERYRDFKRHGRSMKDAPTDQGSWSSGEFRTLQSMVLDNGAAVFFNKAKDTILRRESVRFQFTVPREASQWRVQAASQVYLPAYSGTIWIDVETSRVLRLELESRGIPEGFPVSKAETMVDYDFIALGSRKFLLPSAAASLVCETGTKVCSKNEIQFRHYKTFGAESKITFEEK